MDFGIIFNLRLNNLNFQSLKLFNNFITTSTTMNNFIKNHQFRENLSVLKNSRCHANCSEMFSRKLKSLKLLIKQNEKKTENVLFLDPYKNLISESFLNTK